MSLIWQFFATPQRQWLPQISQFKITAVSWSRDLRPSEKNPAFASLLSPRIESDPGNGITREGASEHPIVVCEISDDGGDEI